MNNIDIMVNDDKSWLMYPIKESLLCLMVFFFRKIGIVNTINHHDDWWLMMSHGS